MKTKFFFALGAAALLASCSNDVVVDAPAAGTIEFTATAGKASRAAGFTSGNIAAEGNTFNVWAFTTDGAKYGDGMVVTSNGTKWTNGTTTFWPATALNFYAVMPSGAGTADMTGTNKTLAYTVGANADEDLLFATVKGATKSSSATTLFFHHALSQVVFQAKTIQNSAVKVEVSEIAVAGFVNSGTYTWNNETTAASLVNQGSWGSLGADKVGYTVATAPTPKELTETAAFIAEGENNLFVMPQTLTAWDHNGAVAAATGAYVKVKCKVSQNNLQLWPATGDADYVYIPLGVTLDQGKKYTFTLVFGEGAGYDEEGKPVLVPVQFDVNVDGWDAAPGNADVHGSTDNN